MFTKWNRVCDSHSFHAYISLPTYPPYTINSLVYVSTTNIYLDYTGYMFRPVNRSSSGHQSNKSKVLLSYWDPPQLYTIQNLVLIKIYCQIKTVKTWAGIRHLGQFCHRPKCLTPTHVLTVLIWQHILISTRFYIVYNCGGSQYLNSTLDLFDWWPDDDLLTGRNM